MKKLISKILLWIHKKIIWKPCIMQRRLFSSYNKRKDWFKNDCPYCNNDYILIRESIFFIIIENKYPYPDTKEHLLLIPKKHIRKVDEMTKAEQKDWIKIISIYMNNWYLVLNRHFWWGAWASVEHFHTHIIKELEM